MAWTGFVIAGYLIPLNWTGFRGQTLWDWFELLVLPAAVTITMTLTSMRGRGSKACLRPYQNAIIAALLRWVSGNTAGRASAAHEAAAARAAMAAGGTSP